MAWEASIQQASRREPTWIADQNHALHRGIVAKIRRQPHLLGIAVENLRRWKRSSGRGLDPAFKRWKLILMTWELEEILAFLLDPSKEARKLRRHSPFCGILTEQEQRQALAQPD